MKKKNNEVGREVALQISKYSNIQSQELKYRILGRKQTLEPNREPDANLFTYKKAEAVQMNDERMETLAFHMKK